MAPRNSLRRSLFYTLAGVEHVHFEAPDTIVGRWWDYPRHFYCENNVRRAFVSEAPKKLLEEFANCRDDRDGVLRFTKRYGPLEIAARGGEEFRFSVKDWAAAQARFRGIWNTLRYVPVREETRGGKKSPVYRVRPIKRNCLPAAEGEEFCCLQAGYGYKTSNLFRLMVLQLYAFDHRRLEICKCPDCLTRYFVAAHLKQQYCSPSCAEWAQREWKRNWWEKEGSSQRAKSRRMRKAEKRRRKYSRGKFRKRGPG